MRNPTVEDELRSQLAAAYESLEQISCVAVPACGVPCRSVLEAVIAMRDELVSLRAAHQEATHG